MVRLTVARAYPNLRAAQLWESLDVGQSVDVKFESGGADIVDGRYVVLGWSERGFGEGRGVGRRTFELAWFGEYGGSGGTGFWVLGKSRLGVDTRLH